MIHFNCHSFWGKELHCSYLLKKKKVLQTKLKLDTKTKKTAEIVSNKKKGKTNTKTLQLRGAIPPE